MNAIAPFKCLLACVTATTMCAMMTACSPSRTPSSDASSTAKRPASTVEVRRGGITPLSSSSTGVQVAPVFSLTTPAKGWFHSTTDQGAYVHAGDVLGTVGDQQVTAPVDGVIETVAQDNDMAADYPLFSIRYGGMSASVDATALLATIDPDQPLTGRFQITDAQGPTDCAAVVNDGVATPPSSAEDTAGSATTAHGTGIDSHTAMPVPKGRAGASRAERHRGTDRDCGRGRLDPACHRSRRQARLRPGQQA